MVQSSYLDVFSISPHRGSDEAIHEGDVVRTGPNLFPHYTVLCVHGDKAWVRNVANGIDGIVMVSMCRKVEVEANGQAYDPADSARVGPYPGR